MEKPLRILIVEDLATDVVLLKHELGRIGISFSDQVVETKEAFLQSLQVFLPDIILSDYSMPRFNGMEALQIRNEISPDTPFILVAGSTNEEIAVECMKSGADDYLIKGNLARLGSAINAAIEKHYFIRKNIVAEIALQQSEKKFRTIFENIQDVFYQVDNEERIKEISPSIYRYSGYTREELIGKSVHEIYQNSEDRERMLRVLNEIGEVKDYDVILKSKSGLLKWVSLNLHRHFDADGHPIGLEGSLRDITERKRAEEDLKESEEKFRSLAETAPYAIMIYQDDFWVYTNPAGEEITGYSAAELYRMRFWEFVSEEHQEMIIRNGRTRQTGNNIISSYEFKIISRDGTEKWVYFTGNTTKYKGKPAGIISVIDISDRKKAEFALKKSQALLQEVFEILPVGLWIADKEGKLIKGNPAGIRIWGAEPEVGIGEYGIFKARKLPEGTEVKPENCALARTIKEGITIENELLEIDAFDGKKKVILNFTAPVKDETGKMLFAVVVNNDITDLKNIEQELIKAKEKAEDSDRLKTAFLANMSHEIRTPMNGILGFSELLDDENLSQEERRKFISIISSSSKHLLTVINDIIDLAKIESNQMNVSHADFNLNQLLDELFLVFDKEKNKTGKMAIDLIVEKAWEDDQSIFHSDEIRIRQVFNNLIGNAFKFTSSGFIRFGYKPGNGKLLFYVQDTGKGISRDKQEIVFERFRQEEESHTRYFGGSGLGLPISRGLIEKLGGELWLDSTEGTGSTFWFSLPIPGITQSITREAQIPVHRQGKELNGKTILVAEDVYDNFELIEIMLKKTQANFLYASNGQEAITQLEKNPDIELILMDIQMPVLNGYEATREIRKTNSAIPIIALTAHAYTEDRQKCMESGCSDFITKPINKEKLMDVLSLYLGKE